MNARDLSRLLIRVAGLFVIVEALVGLPGSFERVQFHEASSPMLAIIGMTLAPFALSLGAGLILFSFAGTITDRVLVTSPPDAARTSTGMQAAEEIALTVLGVYVLVNGISECVYYVAKAELIASALHADSARAYQTPQETAGLFAGAFRVVAGLLLIGCSRGLVVLRRRLLSLRDLEAGERAADER